MAATILQELMAEGKGYVVVPFSFAPNGSSAIDEDDNKGKGFSVARTGAGEYTVTFDNEYHDMICCLASLQLATAADTFLVVGTWTAADRTIVLTAMDNNAGTIAAADVAADANNRVNGLAVFRKTSVAV